MHYKNSWVNFSVYFLEQAEIYRDDEPVYIS
jgi:hypothetical protein